MRARTLLLRAARLRDRLVARLRPLRPPPGPPVVRLDDVRRRIGLLLLALYGDALVVEAHEAPAAKGFLSRLGRRRARAHEALATSEGPRVILPEALVAADGADRAVRRYRLLAVEQAERIRRGTASVMPAADPLERDLFLLREAMAVDDAIARTAPGLRGDLATERARALASRPSLRGLSALEREVELMVREALGRAPDGLPRPERGEHGPAPDGPEASRAWAQGTAQRLRARRDSYRGVAPVPLWGAAPPTTADADRLKRPPNPFTQLQKSDGLIEARSVEGGDSTEPADRPAPDPDQAARDAESPEGDGPPTGQAAGAEAPVPDEGSPPDAPEGALPLGAGGVASDVSGARIVTQYPEWDHRAQGYGRRITVRSDAPPEGERAWAGETLRAHAAQVRQIRHRFERLRAQRARLHRQRDGDELDIEAVVRALAEQRAGNAPDDRLYVAERPARRPLAIALLVDTSGSTEIAVSAAHAIIDVERIALLLAGEALDALGDRWAALTFSGQGADDVRVRTVKDFAERNGEAVHARIAALEPGGFTRLGAAVRHAAALLGREPAGHRLLLVLSDGRPNDIDGYQGDYGVEDARQAVHEARALGIVPFCLTVDWEETEYLAHIFGRAGYTILRDPEQLPAALLGVVRQALV